MSDLLRIYTETECGSDGYPLAWHRCPNSYCRDGWVPYEPNESGGAPPILCRRCDGGASIKGFVRMLAAHRCVRCGHPYRSGENGNGEWSPCDEQCGHLGPLRVDSDEGWLEQDSDFIAAQGRDAGMLYVEGLAPEAQWRILTVHHLDGDKRNCLWWNLAALCQRCHLQIQGKVLMSQVYPYEHSDWFKPYAAGFYAHTYLGEQLSREETMERLDELLGLERVL